MKGILPKPTLLELDEYDINQRVIEILTTTCSHAVLFSIVNAAKDAVEKAAKEEAARVAKAAQEAKELAEKH